MAIRAPAPASSLSEVLGRIEGGALAANRRVDDIHLIAVSKTRSKRDIEPLLEAGHRRFGENRVQEAFGKWPELKQRYENIELHLIGPLQSNKTREAVGLFDVIETVDRPKIAQSIAREIERSGRSPGLFIQVNTGEEAQKAGVVPLEADRFIAMCREELDLDIAGLMCIPPVNEEPSLHFALLAKIAARNGIGGLSMGMSADFETAIAFGANYVRVGTALFGPREPLCT